MCADRDSTSSPGLRAQLSRLLHGLLQHRVFQLLGAAWSYLMGLPGASFFSFLPPAWLLQRSVGPEEFPEVLEALGLRAGPWEELGECLEELAPWKELLSPAMKADPEMRRPWSGKEQESWDSAMEELGSWHSKVQALWEPASWRDAEEAEECCSKPSLISAKVSGPCHLDGQKPPARGHPPPPLVSCIFNPGSGGVFTWLDLGSDHILKNQDVLDEISRPGESKVEIEHIRNKRLWFLQQNQSPDVPSDDPQAGAKQPAQGVSALTDPTPLDLPVSGWHEERNEDPSPGSQLLSGFHLDHSSVLELLATDSDSKTCPALPLLLQKADVLGDVQNKYPPSPDQDQGYHSLEDWQCINITQGLPSGGLSPAGISGSVQDNDGAQVLAEPSVMKALEGDENSDDMASDLEEEICSPAAPVCKNKHIGYILGTVVSDDEEEDPGSSCGEEEDDDGFDSEGSVFATDSDSTAPVEVVLWTSFCSTDPYNPQNFTASLQTGPVAEVTAHPEDTDLSDDEESWCDSDAVSDSASEDDFSADEQENLKLWNGFLKSEDPYNPLFFKASVQTSERKRQNADAATKYSELVCTSPSSCEVTVPTHRDDSWPLRVREKRCVSMEQSASAGHKKVTFYEKVTIYYVGSEEERKGHWEEFARDRCRFQRRIQETQSLIGHCFTPDHRQRVWNRMQEIWGS